MIGAVVEVGKLLGVVLDAIAASVGVATLFSLVVLGIARASEQRERNTSGLLAYATLAVLCLLGCLAAGAYGVALIASK
jgi:nitrate reductase gamma subunit